MAKRYYVCDIVGDGSESDPFRPAIADHGVSYAVVFPPQNQDGSYTQPHCFAVVATKNHDALRGDSRIDPMPDFPLDGKVNAIRTDTKNAIEARLAARGFTKDWQDSAGYRDVIRSVGRQLEPSFSEDGFDVAE